MTMPPVPPLPAMGIAILLRALFKRPGAERVSAEPVRFAINGLDLAHVRRYSALLGFGPDGIPLTYLYLIAQRAQLSTMLVQDFPFRIPGMIHVRNDLAEHAALDPHRPLLLSTTVQMRPPEPNGARYCVLETTGEQDGRRVFTCSSEYMAVRGRRAEGQRARPEEDELPAPIGHWRLALDAGRRYAAVSGDWNPIHLWPWSARLMGMRAPIIHGMHTIGKVCALLETAQGRRVTAVACRFTAPIALGKEAVLAQPGPGTFAVRCDGRLAVEGRFDTA